MINDDPILALIPDPPGIFERLPPDDQAWRGRLFLVSWCAGWPPDMSWWFALRAADAPDIVAARVTMERVSDAMIPAMVAARIYFDGEMARQTALGGQ